MRKNTGQKNSEYGHYYKVKSLMEILIFYAVSCIHCLNKQNE